MTSLRTYGHELLVMKRRDADQKMAPLIATLSLFVVFEERSRLVFEFRLFRNGAFAIYHTKPDWDYVGKTKPI